MKTKFCPEKWSDFSELKKDSVFSDIVNVQEYTGNTVDI